MLFVSSFSLYAQEKSSSDLADARAAVKRNLQTTEGCQYDSVISTEFPEKFQGSMQHCTKSAGEKDLANFEIFIKIEGDGAVRKALVFPQTRVALCLREDVLKGRFSAPPKPGYWIKVEMQMVD
jgi:hypothetical protein